MKIFDSSPEITLEPPRRWRTLAIGALGVAVSLAFGAALFYQHKTYTAQLETANRALLASQAQVKQLRTKLGSMKEKLDAAALNVSNCASNLAAETSKVAAFAKQAAACEVIREKLHVKG